MTVSTADARSRAGLGTALLTGVGAGVAASLANVAIAAIARGVFGANDDFVPLTAGPVVWWTVVGALVGAIGWLLITRFTRRPRTLLRTLVPVVVILSFVPDVLLLVSDPISGQTTGGVVALMVMHVATAAIVVTAFWRTMAPCDRSE